MNIKMLKSKVKGVVQRMSLCFCHGWHGLQKGEK